MIHLLTKLDYEKMSENNRDFSKELTEYVLNPVRLCSISNKYNMDLEEYIELF